MSIGETKDGRWYCHFRDFAGKGCREYFGRGPEAKKAAERRDLEVRLAKKRPRTEPVLAEFGTPIFQALAQDSHLPFPTASPPLIFDGKYFLTRENSPPILRAVRSNTLSINFINQNPSASGSKALKVW